jgi:hypothetical protein
VFLQYKSEGGKVLVETKIIKKGKGIFLLEVEKPFQGNDAEFQDSIGKAVVNTRKRTKTAKGAPSITVLESVTEEERNLTRSSLLMVVWWC